MFQKGKYVNFLLCRTLFEANLEFTAFDHCVIELIYANLGRFFIGEGGESESPAKTGEEIFHDSHTHISCVSTKERLECFLGYLERLGWIMGADLLFFPGFLCRGFWLLQQACLRELGLKDDLSRRTY